MLSDKQRDLLLTGTEFKKNGIDAINRELVVGFDNVRDSKRKMEILLNDFKDIEDLGTKYRGNQRVVDDLMFAISNLSDIERQFDNDIRDLNPHIEDVRVANA